MEKAGHGEGSRFLALVGTVYYIVIKVFSYQKKRNDNQFQIGRQGWKRLLCTFKKYLVQSWVIVILGEIVFLVKMQWGGCIFCLLSNSFSLFSYSSCFLFFCFLFFVFPLSLVFFCDFSNDLQMHYFCF